MFSYKENYDITSRGFLPVVCCEEFPKCYKYLQYFLNVMGTKDNETFQETVIEYKFNEEEMEQNINDVSLAEQKYIYSTCSILAHKYVWMFDNVPETVEIPYSIAKPWHESSEVLGIKCVLTHASVDLYNWRLKNPTIPFCLDNIESINLMKGVLPNYTLEKIKDSESWFYLIMVAIEGTCGPMINNMENIYKLLEQKDSLRKKDDILINLLEIRDYLITQSQLISRIYEKCEPEIFYKQTRKYLWGSNKTSNGWNLQGIDGPPLKEDGGSAAQSSLISLEDIFFSIEHNDKTGEFLMRMRDYMPRKHRQYLEYCEGRHKLKDYVTNYIELEELYNHCIELVVDFRKKHLKIVHDYVIMPSKQQQPEEDSDDDSDSDSDSNDDDDSDTEEEGETGTGGTNPITFLSEVIKETNETKIVRSNTISSLFSILFFYILFIIIITYSNM